MKLRLTIDLRQLQMYSVIVPIYRNEETIEKLFDRLDRIAAELKGPLEVVFVIDGSPDNCYELIELGVPGRAFTSQLIRLSRNFGSFAAIRMGLEHATGQYMAVMAADLQEPESLGSQD